MEDVVNVEDRELVIRSKGPARGEFLLWWEVNGVLRGFSPPASSINWGGYQLRG
jgi:hypothetical protein